MLWVRKVYINHRGNYPEGVLCYTAAKGFALLGLEIAPFYGFGDLATLGLKDDTMVVGFVGDVREAIKLLGHPAPDTPDYPDELRGFLRRSVYRQYMGEIRNSTKKMFIKPTTHKLFTGHVRQGLAVDNIRTASVPDDELLWVSDPIDIVSEYRCYIMCGQLIGMRWYKGDPFVAPSREIVQNAVAAWATCPAACTLDFGIDTGGHTVLIEANDGFAFGNYGLPPIAYARMLEARWREMVGGPMAPPLEPIPDYQYR